MMIAMLLASANAMPSLDRRWLDQQAKIEAVAPSRRKASVRSATYQARQMLAGDIDAIGTVCAAASTTRDPARFITSIASAFKMPSEEIAGLRSKCALYLIGRRDGGRR